MTPLEFIARLREEKVFAILRAPRPEHVVAAAKVLAGAGMRVIEVTFTVPDAAGAIAELRRELPDHLVGAGTLRTARDVADAVGAGAQFLVTPSTTPELTAALRDTGLPALPGVLTPAEVAAVLAAGIPAVKLFPGGIVGPGYLRQLLGPFPELLAVPTGGVGVDDVDAWLASGAVAVGISSALCSAEEMAAGAWDEVRARVERLRGSVVAA